MKILALFPVLIAIAVFVHAEPPLPKAYHRIESKGAPGECLAISGDGEGKGRNVLTWRNSYSDEQQWELRPAKKGCFHIVSRTTGKYLTAEDGDADSEAGVFVASETEEDDQLWKLRFDADGFAKIVSKQSGLAITSHGGREKVIQEERIDTDRQKWKVSLAEKAEKNQKKKVEKEKAR